jgi:group II intron reverse transcriptase/maturase
VPKLARSTKQDSVRELQRTLYRAAKADPRRRFHALYDKVHRRDVLERAWGLVRANDGAAGIDKQTIADVEEYGIAKLLDELTVDLKDASWRPLPARRVFIPKPGKQELRPLSIPAVRDRVVQAAVKIVIEPIFEADMLECSYGFRPRRSTFDALQVLIDESWRGRRWVAESDIANCFEAIPHSGLMSAIEERICDRRLLKLLRAMLRAGVMHNDAVAHSDAGTPQGGVISPCLCNVYLTRLDRQWAERGHGELVRYADDLLAICRSKQEAERARAALSVILAELGLELKPAKTRIVHLADEGEGSLGRAGARCRRYRRSVSPTRPPNRTCPFLSIRLSTGHPLADRDAALGNGGLRRGGGPSCAGGRRPWRGDPVAAIAISGDRNLGGPREPRAFAAGPVAPPAPSPDLFPGQSRVLLTQPANHSPPQVVAEIREAALRRVMTVVVGPTPQDWVERVDQLIQREV